MPKLYTVATPIGNLRDVSPRAAEVLESVAHIAAEDTRVSPKLLQHLGLHKPMTSYHKFNESRQAEALIAQMLSADIDMALISDAGTPCISDPGFFLVEAALSAGIDVLPIPGPNAAAAAISASGIRADSFAFLGFLPRNSKAKIQRLRDLLSAKLDCAVIYESPLRIVDTLRDIESALGDVRVSAFREMTKLFETHYHGPVSEVAHRIEADANGRKGEYTLVCALPAPQESASEEISLEARLLDIMMRTNTNSRDAAKILIDEGQSRNAVYAAKLRLAEYMEGFDE